MVFHYMCALPVATYSLILMLRSLYFLPHTQRILPLFIVVPPLLLCLLMFCISLSQILLPPLMILYFLLNLHSYNSYTHLQNRYIFLGTLLTLKSAVGRMLYLPQRISLKSGLSLITLGMRTLSFSLFNSRIPQIPQILLPLITRNGSVLPRSMSPCSPPPSFHCSRCGSDYNFSTPSFDCYV